MTSESCLAPETLERLLLGDLPAPQLKTSGEHLLHCEKCTAAAETIIASDALTEAIRVRRTFHGDEKLLAQVIERGQKLHSEVATLHSEETLIVGKSQQQGQDGSTTSPSSDPKLLDEEIDFLAPPECSDEIGRLGEYRILNVLGVGGMGVVFRAEDPGLKRQVALKAMKPAIAASRLARDRFVREAQATAAFEHDNIVSIYQVGEDRGIPFIAMPFLRGEPLKARIDREKQLDQHEILRIGREVAAGLAAAHSQHLIHRDIKPDNIWIEAKDGRAKVLDFGLVRSVSDDAGLTQSGVVLGTPRYMSPEQAQGLGVDHRCDLFSLGSVLYHLATGRAPFNGSNLTATLMAVAHEDPEPIETVCPNLHPDLTDLVNRLLSKDRDQRPRSAA